METILTICIPTYNRAKMTSELIMKLPSTNQVEYLVVDDGSKSEELESLSDFMEAYDFKSNIKLLKKENGGKMSAVKYSLKYAKGAYFMDLDSDDFLNKIQLAQIINDLKILQTNYSGNDKIIGITGLCFDTRETLIGTKYPKHELVSNIIKIYADYGVKGDKRPIIKTEVLRSIEFPFFKNEKRVPTSTQWNLLSQNYSVICFNHSYSTKRYLPDGLTSNILKARIASKNSSRLPYKYLLKCNYSVYKSKWYRLKAMINYLRFGFHGADPMLEKEIFSKKLNIVYLITGFIPSFLLYLFDNKRMRNINSS